MWFEKIFLLGSLAVFKFVMVPGAGLLLRKLRKAITPLRYVIVVQFSSR